MFKNKTQISIRILLLMAFGFMAFVITAVLSVSVLKILNVTYDKATRNELSDVGKDVMSIFYVGQRPNVGRVGEQVPVQTLPDNLGSYFTQKSMQYNADIYLYDVSAQSMLYQNSETKHLDEKFLEEDFIEVLNNYFTLQPQAAYISNPYNGREFIYANRITAEGLDYILFIRMSTEMFAGVEASFKTSIILISAAFIAGSILLSDYLSKKITTPLNKINAAASEVAKGNFDIDVQISTPYKELNRLVEVLSYTKSEIAKSDKLQKDLIANISHDLKTPLTMIKAYASAIQEITGEIPEKRNRHAQIIIDEADRLTELVNDSLQMSKIQANMGDKRVFNLSNYVDVVLDRFNVFETRGYVFERRITSDLFINAVKEQIAQVLYNLIGNAVNYTGDDKTVKVSLTCIGEVAKFEVADTGKGIAPEDIGEIWGRYKRASETHSRVKGTGLGLAIVKSVLDRHGFNYGIVSEVGKGSTFYVDFPLSEATESELYEDDENLD